jgi:hypothetical protein
VAGASPQCSERERYFNFVMSATDINAVSLFHAQLGLLLFGFEVG